MKSPCSTATRQALVQQFVAVGAREHRVAQRAEHAVDARQLADACFLLQALGDVVVDAAKADQLAVSSTQGVAVLSSTRTSPSRCRQRSRQRCQP